MGEVVLCWALDEQDGHEHMPDEYKSYGENRGEMGRSLVTTGRMVMMRSIGYK